MLQLCYRIGRPDDLRSGGPLVVLHIMPICEPHGQQPLRRLSHLQNRVPYDRQLAFGLATDVPSGVDDVRVGEDWHI